MSADKIDHKAEALRNIEGLHDYQSEEGMSDASMLTVAIEAQAHAILYAAEQTAALAEQQRVANLLAAAQFITKQETVLGVGYTGLAAWAQDSQNVVHGELAEASTWIALLGEGRAKKEGLA